MLTFLVRKVRFLHFWLVTIADSLRKRNMCCTKLLTHLVFSLLPVVLWNELEEG